MQQHQIEMEDDESQSAFQFARWKIQSVHKRDKEGFPPESRPWTSKPGITLSGVANVPRQREILDLAYLSHRKANPGLTSAALVANLWANPSQSVSREPWM